jgi:hypothetical protein
MSKYSNYLVDLEDLLGGLLEDMTNEQALVEVEKLRGTIARNDAESILDRWEREFA